MDEQLQQKLLEEVSSLKDLFLRRLVDDKVKMAAISQLQSRNEELQNTINQKAILSLVRELLLVCDRIDANMGHDDFLESVKEELLEILARRDILPIESGTMFDPSIHNSVGAVEADDEHPDKTIVRVVRAGYYIQDRVLRPADVIVAVKRA